ncbi:MAG: DUF3189 family protein [Clostridia bacterium]|nr:DUF3189 family protein [Clostridia bacterium]
MKIIYTCFGGSHASVTAAAIHLGLLSDTREAGNEEFLSLPYYDAQVAEDHGRLRFMGVDSAGNEVYVVGKRSLDERYQQLMPDLIRILGGNPDDFRFIDTMPYVNIWMRIGGYLSRRLKLPALGRNIVLYGTRRSYQRFIHLAQLVKKDLA